MEDKFIPENDQGLICLLPTTRRENHGILLCELQDKSIPETVSCMLISVRQRF